MQTAGSMHVPAPDPSWQSAFSHWELLVHAWPSGRFVTHVGAAEPVSQNVPSSKQRVVHGWPRLGAWAHLFVIVSHG
jgi:hypothetical protein